MIREGDVTARGVWCSGSRSLMWDGRVLARFGVVVLAETGAKALLLLITPDETNLGCECPG